MAFSASCGFIGNRVKIPDSPAAVTLVNGVPWKPLPIMVGRRHNRREVRRPGAYNARTKILEEGLLRLYRSYGYRLGAD